ncbi:tetratricopeptide repeat protein [Dethiosulfatarculus sandiegensis]|uniref:Uncharacterized protein n=1 Tax=Dethiosulfatarculus sandiegensis TaxID=1429043 RepID=A0A0D2HQV4_9BACT|nr:tetratricopeptide repeat protein [Dethiosulfatarculus sandiegensis]KIX12858.1 hypothetical protein X474_17510 [Dethiosulfatarculus sandiegensis]
MNFTLIRIWIWRILTGSRFKALLMEGGNLLKAGHNVEALDLFRQAVRGWPARPEGYQGMGDTYQAMGLRPEANRENTIANALMALEQNPDDHTSRINLARALHEKGMAGYAAGHMDQIIHKFSKDVETLRLAAIIFRDNGNFSRAADALRHLVYLDPLNTEYYDNLTLCLTKLNQGTEALTYLSISKALSQVEKDPNDLEAVEQAVRQFVAAGQKQSALLLVERTIGSSSKPNGLYRMQGELLLSERRIPEAEKALRQAVANDPTDLKAHRMLSNLYKLRGEKKLAQQHQELAEAMEKARKSGDPVATEMAMVRLLLRSGKKDLARERVEALKANHPRDWRGPFLEGLMAKSQGNTNQAMGFFQAARRLDVTAPDPHIEIARIHSKMDDMIGAVSEARQAVALSPRDPEVRIALAEILRAHGYMDQAIEEEELAESLAKRGAK